MLKAWKTIDTRQVFSLPSRVTVSIDTVELPNGLIIDDYCQIQTDNHVVVHAETVDGLLVCLRQYRYAARRVGLTLPAGNIASGETPISAAERELLEETGYRAGEWHELGYYPLHGSQSVSIGHLFAATACVQVAQPQSGDLEEAIVELHPRNAVMSAVRRNEFLVLSDIAAIGLAAWVRSG